MVRLYVRDNRGRVGEVGVNVQIHECHRNNLCIDCDNKRCWHSGELIADCPMYKCNREGDFFEDCESCELLKQIHVGRSVKWE